MEIQVTETETPQTETPPVEIPVEAAAVEIIEAETAQAVEIIEAQAKAEVEIIEARAEAETQIAEVYQSQNSEFSAQAEIQKLREELPEMIAEAIAEALENEGAADIPPIATVETVETDEVINDLPEMKPEEIQPGSHSPKSWNPLKMLFWGER